MRKLMRVCLVFICLAFILSISLLNPTADARSDERGGFVDPSLLEIGSAEFAADPYSKANYDPFIKIKVVNNSASVITRAFINCSFTADNGKHKLFSERFVQIVDGGLKPYAVATWLFYPRGSSALALKGLPRDTRVVATVEQVFCPKKNSPWQYEHKFNYPKRHDFAF